MSSTAHTGKVREMFLNSIRALAEALEAKDPYTAGHSKRVTDISVDIALALGLSRDAAAEIRLAAMFHDIGKIGVRESVLNKEGALTGEEYDHIMQHCEIGRRILEPIFGAGDVLDVVMYHHEKFDGTGRPAGLLGDGIPLGARIIGLADAIDAMGSVRPYRPKLSPERIAAEVRKGAGSHFDPAIVDAFFRTASAAKLLRTDDAAGAAVRPASAPAPPDLPPHPLVSRAQLDQAIHDRGATRPFPPEAVNLLRLASKSPAEAAALVASALRDRSITAALAGIFQAKSPSPAVDRAGLIRHSLACALLCRALAETGAAVQPEIAFLAGFFHDLGVAVLDDIFPAEYARCLAYAAHHGQPLAAAEKPFIGATHAAVAAELAGAWRIDERFRLPMALHHEAWSRATNLQGQTGLLVGAVKLADLAAKAIRAGNDSDPVLEDVPLWLLRRLKLDPAKIASVLAGLESQMQQLEPLFFPSRSGAAPAAPSNRPRFSGKNALFVAAPGGPFDAVEILLKGLAVETFAAPNVRKGAAAKRTDLVVIRGCDDAVLTANLRELSELSKAGLVGPVKVLILGTPGADGRLSSIYPAKMTASLEEPYSIPAIERSLTLLFSN